MALKAIIIVVQYVNVKSVILDKNYSLNMQMDKLYERDCSE
uniref:Uncharacterized protein n=1 Tax=Onchocerca volvulus TaxID=6282 RepID=A0A8R1TNN8_ONCVO